MFIKIKCTIINGIKIMCHNVSIVYTKDNKQIKAIDSVGKKNAEKYIFAISRV